MLTNPGFESNLSGWTTWANPSTGTINTILPSGCPTGKCLQHQPQVGIKMLDINQDIGTLVPNQNYVFRFKFNSYENIYFWVRDQNWKNSQNQVAPKNVFMSAFYGADQWIDGKYLFKTPAVDDSGESIATHNWNFRIYALFTEGQTLAPISLDEIFLASTTETAPADRTYLPPFGCDTNATAACLDFGAADDDATTIVFSTSLVSGRLTEGAVTYREQNPLSILSIKIPQFNADADGLPLSPLVLEIRYKDVFDEDVSASSSGRTTTHRALVRSRFDFSTDATLIPTRTVRYNNVADLGGKNDGQWKTMQYFFDKTPFQLIRAVNGYYEIGITMPNVIPGDTTLTLPLDYVSLRTTNALTVETVRDTNREEQGFILVPPPTDAPDQIVLNDTAVQPFVRDLMKPIFLNTIPSAAEIDQPVVGFSAPGEVEPLNLGIYSQNGVSNLLFSISDLTSTSSLGVASTIDSSLFDFYHVANKEVRWDSYGTRTSEFYGILPDHLEALTNLDVAAGTSERVWIKARIPTTAKKGLYEGLLTIFIPGQLAKKIPVQLDILATHLDHSRHLNAIMDPYTKALSPNNADIVDLHREVGFDPSLSGIAGRYTVTKNSNGDVVDIDVSEFESYLDQQISDKTLTKGALVNYSDLNFVNVVYGTAPAGGLSTLYARLNDPKFQTPYKMLIQRLMAAAQSRGVTLIFKISDEPGNNISRRIPEDRLATFIKDVGGLTTETYFIDCDNAVSAPGYGLPNDTIPPLTNLIDYKMWPLTWQGNGYERSPENHGYYTTHASSVRNPVSNRFLHGLFATRTNAAVVYAYAMGDYINDPYNDFDMGALYLFPVTYPDFLLMYPSWKDKPRFTLSLEGIREGIKDAKYIATLERLIQTTQHQAARDAQRTLDEVKQRINPDFTDEYLNASHALGYSYRIFKNVSETGDPDDAEAFTKIRRKIFDHINNLTDIRATLGVSDDSADEKMGSFKNIFKPGKEDALYINYKLSRAQQVEVNLYNRKGELVRTLANSEKPAGINLEPWDGRNDQGQLVASGIYLLKINFEDSFDTRKIVVIK